MWLNMFCIIIEDMNGWLTQEGGPGLNWKRSRVAVYVLNYYRGHEPLAEPGGWGGFKMEGESWDCVGFVLL